MKTRWLILSLCLAAAAWARAAEPSVDELIQRLHAILQRTPAGQADPRSIDLVPFAVSKAYQLGGTDRTETVETVVRRFTTDAATLKLAATLDARVAEDLKKIQAANSALDAEVDAALQAALTAKEPKELDPWIMKLARQCGPKAINYPRAGTLNKRTSDAVTFLCRWQDYLLLRKMGREDRAREELTRLTQNRATDTLVPRSEILRRMTDDGSRERAFSLKGLTLDNVSDRKRELEEEQARNGNSYPLEQKLLMLIRLKQAKENVVAGRLGEALQYGLGDYDDDDAALFRPKQQLLLSLLPDYLEVAKAYPVKDKDTPVRYLRRVIQETQAKKDWATEEKALFLYEKVGFGSQGAPAWVGAPVRMVGYLALGQELEKAGLYADAVNSYRRTAGETTGDETLKEAAARIAAIKKEHPEEYAEAIKPLPPATIIDPVMPGRRGAQP